MDPFCERSSLTQWIPLRPVSTGGGRARGLGRRRKWVWSRGPFGRPRRAGSSRRVVGVGRRFRPFQPGSRRARTAHDRFHDFPETPVDRPPKTRGSRRAGGRDGKVGRRDRGRAGASSEAGRRCGWLGRGEPTAVEAAWPAARGGAGPGGLGTGVVGERPRRQRPESGGGGGWKKKASALAKEAKDNLRRKRKTRTSRTRSYRN